MIAKAQVREAGAAAEHAHDEAVVLAGQVYGKILNREADKPGYEYVLFCFESGKKSVREIVLEFISSAEFIERFFLGKSPEESVDLVHRLLLGHEPEDANTLKHAQLRFVRMGLRKYAERIIASAEYKDMHLQH